MFIWFYLFIFFLIISLVLLIKVYLIHKEINNIWDSLDYILKSDTNNIITIISNDKYLRKLANSLNKRLKELRELELEYKEGNQELKISMTNISHDIRTPLTAIRGYLDLIDEDDLTKKQKEYFKCIDNKTRELTNLTEQLFDFTKSLDRYNVLNKQDLVINSAIENIISTYYYIFKESNIEPKINITKKRIVCNIDETMLTRIFENIISNALKYSDGDFNIVLDDTGKITISNKASLLDKTSVKKIFNRYFTVENARKNSGVGLAIAKQLVELNDGVIEAKYLKGNLIIEMNFKVK